MITCLQRCDTSVYLPLLLVIEPFEGDRGKDLGSVCNCELRHVLRTKSLQLHKFQDRLLEVLLKGFQAIVHTTLWMKLGKISPKLSLSFLFGLPLNFYPCQLSK